MSKLIRVYVPYWEWEDFKNGMWRKVDKLQEESLLAKCIEFTSNWELYGENMYKVSIEWPMTMLNTLSNIHVNRRAFLGHCACQYAINCPEYITRMAWKHLTDKQRIDADAIAQKHINNWVKEYERKNRKVHTGLGEQMLFEWPS